MLLCFKVSLISFIPFTLFLSLRGKLLLLLICVVTYIRENVHVEIEDTTFFYDEVCKDDMTSRTTIHHFSSGILSLRFLVKLSLSMLVVIKIVCVHPNTDAQRAEIAKLELNVVFKMITTGATVCFPS